MTAALDDRLRPAEPAATGDAGLDALFVRTAALLARTADLDAMIEAVVAAVGPGLAVDRCMIGLYPPDIERYSFQYIWHGPAAPVFERITMLGRTRNPSFRLLLTGATYRCDDTAADPRIASMRGFYRAYGIRATLFHGLWRDGVWWGAVGVHSCAAPRIWREAEVRFLVALADQIALAIDLIRWRERARQAAAERAGEGAPPREPPTERQLAAAGVTAAERRVLRLLARGRTNAEIAGELNLSRRTVESHVTSMLGKLGLRNRVELARLFLHRAGGA